MILTRSVVYPVVCLIVFDSWCGSAVAAGKVQSGFFEFPQVAPPLSMTWQIATSGGQSVSATFTEITPFAFNQLFITPENASSLGVDFAAWSAAVMNPAYTRSIITAGGVSQEGPVVRSGDPAIR
jgi:hypothetical protein